MALVPLVYTKRYEEACKRKRIRNKECKFDNTILQILLVYLKIAFTYHKGCLVLCENKCFNIPSIKMFMMDLLRLTISGLLTYIFSTPLLNIRPYTRNQNIAGITSSSASNTSKKVNLHLHWFSAIAVSVSLSCCLQLSLTCVHFHICCLASGWYWTSPWKAQKYVVWIFCLFHNTIMKSLSHLFLLSKHHKDVLFIRNFLILLSCD